jgi:hypothetical protein
MKSKTRKPAKVTLIDAYTHITLSDSAEFPRAQFESEDDELQIRAAARRPSESLSKFSAASENGLASSRSRNGTATSLDVATWKLKKCCANRSNLEILKRRTDDHASSFDIRR